MKMCPNSHLYLMKRQGNVKAISKRKDFASIMFHMSEKEAKKKKEKEAKGNMPAWLRLRELMRSS